MSDETSNRPVAIVTGSASGIGEAIARRFAEAGAGVVVNARSPDGPGVKVAEMLPDSIFVPANVAVPDEAARLAEAAVSRWGRIDYLVNCAGATRVVPFGDLEGVKTEDWQACFGVNTVGIWNTVKASLPELKRCNGAVVNVTSASGIMTTGSSIPYSVSKAAANHLTRLLAKTLAPDVRVNAVAPGYIETPLSASMGPDMRRGFESRASLGRAGQPNDIAEAAHFLATSRFSTGTVMLVDGGLSVG